MGQHDARGCALSSCLDVSQWQPVDAKTREPVTLPADRITKYQVLTTLEK
ncbi:hypothetical protein [Streptomyces sp. 303MFCol5.2]|nr:hypothetical protein [Streptomyces sp. 303MFCol5.2]